MKTAIITGITGQDGAYLSKFLINKGYNVIGLTRSYNNSDLFKLSYLKVLNQIKLEECDLLDMTSIIKILKKYNPHEIYNLAAQSSVGLSFDQPLGTINFNLISVINLLEAIKLINPSIKFYQASSSEMFGKVDQLPINENTPMHPLSPYAISKVAAHWLAVDYRESYRMYVCCGIMFNHESFIRSNNFFIKKVITESLEIVNGRREVLKVGNLNIRRDFGYAPKYVEAMYLMMQKERPDDYVVCSGESLLLKDIVLYIFNKLNLSIDKISIDETLYRPLDIQNIYGENAKIKKELAWDYHISFYSVLDLLLEEEQNNLNK